MSRVLRDNMAKVNIPTVKLNNGTEMPVMGYGTWLGVNDKWELLTSECPKLIEAMSYAIDIGYRHIDTAHLYQVEPEVGYVVNKKIEEGVVKREELFITTKVWQHFHREGDVEVSIRGSLRRLNLDYVDQLLVHWPMSVSEEGVDEKIDYLETWRGFEAVLAKGLTKSIGVSNFNVEQMKRLLANCKVKPACNQIEVNLNLAQHELVDYCQSQGVVVVGYMPFGTMVASRLEPNSPEPKLDNPVMVAMAQKYGKTVTQVVLRYLYQRGIVNIPKSISKARVLENASIFDFHIDEEDCEKLKSFDNGYRTNRPLWYSMYTNYPFEKLPTDGAPPPIPKILRKWRNGMHGNID